MQLEIITVLLKKNVVLLAVYNDSVHLSVGPRSFKFSWATIEERNECLRFLEEKQVSWETLSSGLLTKLLFHCLVDFFYRGEATFEVRLEPQTRVISATEESVLTEADFFLNSLGINVPENYKLEILSRDKVRVTSNRASAFFSCLENRSAHPRLVELLKQLNVLTTTERDRKWASHDEFFHTQTRTISHPVLERIAGEQSLDSSAISLSSVESIPIAPQLNSQSRLREFLKKRRSERGHSKSSKLSKSQVLELCTYLLPSGTDYFYPRAGKLNATRCYFYVKSAHDLRKGLYFLNPISRSLDLVSSAKLEKALNSRLSLGTREMGPLTR
jgi:hypothetical protein